MSDAIDAIKKVAEANGFVAASCHESWGTLGNLGVVILLKTKTPLDEQDHSWVSSLGHKAHDAIQESEYRKDPERPGRDAKTKAELLECFEKAGCGPIYVKEIPNEYWRTMCEPWLLVTTKIGPIKIGWRKRVINICWEDSDLKTKAEELFPKEDVTKHDRLIHAWSYDKAVEYLRKIHEAKNDSPTN